MEQHIIEVFAPGEFIKDELVARGWTQADLAAILGRTEAVVSELINGKRAVTVQTAKELAATFGTSAEVWLNLEAQYQLGKDQTQAGSIGRRARVYGYAPVKEMIRRKWIESTSSLDVLEAAVANFFNVGSLDDEPELIPHAARKSTPYAELTHAQSAWLLRARQLAKLVPARTFPKTGIEALVETLRPLMRNPEDTRMVPKVLADFGIRLVLIEHLPGTKIDGATFWLSGQKPVIALSGRYDRIDYFWFTLFHELSHVAAGDGLVEPILDSDLPETRGVSDLPSNELKANERASDFLVPSAELNGFIGRVSPCYSSEAIRGFALRLGVHPGIAVGQLQHRGELDWAQFRRLLVPIRKEVVQSALTDGWGHIVSV